MANITSQNFANYIDKNVGSRNKTFYAQGGYPSINAFYGTYDSLLTAHKTLCAAFGDFDNISLITDKTRCADIPRGFTVAIEDENSIVEYQYKKIMPVSGYSVLDLQIKSIDSADSNEISYNPSFNYKQNSIGSVIKLQLIDISGLLEDTAFLKDDVGTLSQLDTSSKTNLVLAINSLNTSIHEVEASIPSTMSSNNVIYNANNNYTVGSVGKVVSDIEGRVSNVEEDTTAIVNNIGSLSNLNTPAQNVVLAINNGITTAANASTNSAASAAAALQYASAISIADTNFANAVSQMTTLQAGQALIGINSGDIAVLKGNVIDISALYSSTYANLSAALSAINSDSSLTATDLKSVCKSIRFIDSNTNQCCYYVLKSSTFSTNINDWADIVKPNSTEVIYQNGTVSAKIGSIDDQIETLSNNTIIGRDGLTDITPSTISKVDGNSEYLYVIVDSDDKTVFAIKSDGDIEFPYGVPTQIKDEITPLIDSVEFIKVVLDDDGKVIEGITVDGNKVVYADSSLKGKLYLSDGTDVSTIKNIANAIAHVVIGTTSFTNDEDAWSRELMYNERVIYPYTFEENIYNRTSGKSLSTKLSEINDAISSKLSNNSKAVDWDNLSDTVKARISSGGGGGGGGTSFAPKTGDLAFEIDDYNTYLSLYSKLADAYSKGIKYDYFDTDIDTFFDQQNTIYYIRYNHISTNSITIPSGCDLIFIGGSISAPLVFSDTLLLGDVNIKGSTISGTVRNDKFMSSWICNIDGTNDDAANINGMIDVCPTVILEKGTYKLVQTNTYANHSFHIGINKSDRTIIGEGAVIESNYDEVRTMCVYSGLNVTNFIKNIRIEGIEFKRIVTNFRETKHNLAVIGVDGLHIENCVFNEFNGDAICLTFNTAEDSVTPTRNRNVWIRNNKFRSVENENRNSISVIAGTNVWIDSNVFIGGTRTGMVGTIDIEPTRGTNECKNISITNNYISGLNVGYAITVYSQHYTVVNNENVPTCVEMVTIANNHIVDCPNGIHIETTDQNEANVKYITIANNIVRNITSDVVKIIIPEYNGLSLSEYISITDNILEGYNYGSSDNVAGINKLLYENNLN